MSPHAPFRHAAVAFAAAVCIPAVAHAMQPGDIVVSTSVTGVYQFETDLDSGGDVRWTEGVVSGSVIRQLTPQLSAGVSLRYDYETWGFGNPVAFGGKAPWENLLAPNIAGTLTYAIAPSLLLAVAPSFGWSYESGANASDAKVYGAIFSATKVVKSGLAVGIGASIVRQIDETKVFPYVILQWQIDERWRVANPFRAGPAGGAGLEVEYTIDNDWGIAAGGAYRSYRFRLNGDGAAADAIGENRYFPVFARLTRKLGARTNLDFYAGVSVRGRVSVDDGQDTEVVRDDYRTTPALGITLAHRY